MGHMLHVERLEKLIEIGIALSAEQNTDELLEQILRGAKEITGADGGTLYALDAGRREVRMEVVLTDSLHFAMGGTSGRPIPFPAVPLYDTDGSANRHNVVTAAIHDRRTINIPDAYQVVEFDLSGTRAFDERSGYHSTSFLTVPMMDHQGEVIAVLQLLNAIDDESGEVIPFTTDCQRFAEALASQAAIALTKKRLIEDLKLLFEALIQLVATAVDEKSPYTGGHCRRVPEVTMLLADAVHRVDRGQLANFRMSAEERYALEIAAWLHDCGKITTPEHVVDKATKLETIYDRIHAIDMRFEVLKRDAEIALLRERIARLEAGERVDGAAFEAQLSATLATLHQEREFLRTSNRGGEFMAPEAQARVAAIGARTLRGPDGSEQPLLAADEIYNLQIAKGTLTTEERQVINNHIVATINMLEALPFPKNLAQVPEYAGGHHEHMDGSGYPRGLTGAQMPVQSRIMAIADVFEALTASDRPYKSAKTLSEALRILGFMVKEGKLDADLFEVFVQEKVYLRYAERYLEPSQIDEIDLTTLPGLRHGGASLGP